MARNAEKAMTTLARWRAAQLGEGDTQKQRRPFLASECNDLPQAEKWRLQIIREIARKVSQIQNAGLGEFRIRDLNDEINKLLREKSHWEVQIKELGGPDYSNSGPKMLDHDGKEVPGNRGYKYFGAARQLPGVRELFEQAPPPPPHKTRGEMMREVDASYYGYMDDEDGLLIPLEEEQEKIAIAQAVAQWTIKKEKSLSSDIIEEEVDEHDEDEDIYKVSEGEDSEESDSEITAKTLASFKAHVPVPSQKEVEEAILERKKQELLARFAPDLEEMEYNDDNENNNDNTEEEPKDQAEEVEIEKEQTLNKEENNVVDGVTEEQMSTEEGKDKAEEVEIEKAQILNKEENNVVDEVTVEQMSIEEGKDQTEEVETEKAQILNKEENNVVDGVIVEQMSTEEGKGQVDEVEIEKEPILNKEKSNVVDNVTVEQMSTEEGKGQVDEVVDDVTVEQMSIEEGSKSDDT